MFPAIYRAATSAATPLVRLYLRRRLTQGKEDSARFRERFGHTGRPRPPGRLVWVHAASVGEAMSVLALIEALIEQRPGISILITTGTVTAARLLEPRLPTGALHQYVPVDLPGAVKRFLDHWRPDLALWIESELWPNLVLATRRRGIPMALVNGRMSARSHARWRAWPGLSQPIGSAFTLCLAQDTVQAARFRQLGASQVAAVGDLKAAAETLPADPAALGELVRLIGSRPVWLAASTHPGEDEIVATAHAEIAGEHPGLLTIIAPRHPVRGPEIVAMLAARGLSVARRSAGETIGPDTQGYVADTLGELGLFYRLCGIVLVGGSLVEKGGHNPFEPARLDCAILHGPDMRNCAAMARALADTGASETVADASSLARAVSALLKDSAERERRAATAEMVAEEGRQTLGAVLDRLAPLLDALAPLAVTPKSSAGKRMSACRAAATADARS